MLRLSMAAVLLGLASPAAAEWTKAQRTSFLDSCIESCRTTPNLSAQGRLLCPKACECVADEGEKIMTPADMAAAEKAAADGKTTAKLDQLDKVYPMCVQRAAGR